MWEHLTEVSWVGIPVWLFAVVLLLDATLTLIHTLEELKGPLWSYFGAIAGVAFSDAFGIPAFFVGLTLTLWAVAMAGMAGWVPWIGTLEPARAVLWIGALIAARLADSWFSHVRLARAGFEPNPGLRSTRYYLAEGAVLVALFAPGLVAYPLWALLGAALSTLFFVSVLPIFRLLGKLVPSLLRPPWSPRQPIPAWVHSTRWTCRRLGAGWRRGGTQVAS
jgi:hypothetical protein